MERTPRRSEQVLCLAFMSALLPKLLVIPSSPLDAQHGELEEIAVS